MKIKQTHLRQLEAESIHILREVAAEFENPVMLYSIGKDSAVMLHLARKAFYPAHPPFPLLHVDTTWKFREMIEFRDRMARECGFDLLIHINEEGVQQGVSPFSHGSALYTDIMKTEGLKQALDKYKFDAAFGGARRDEEKSRAKERIFSFRNAAHRWDPKSQRPELWNIYNARVRPGREHSRLPPLQLDRARRLAVHLPGADPHCPALLRQGTTGGRARRHADHGRRRTTATSSWGEGRDEIGALSHPRLLPLDRRRRVDRRDPAGDHPGDAADPHQSSARGGSSTTTRPAAWRRRNRKGIFK